MGSEQRVENTQQNDNNPMFADSEHLWESIRNAFEQKTDTKDDSKVNVPKVDLHDSQNDKKPGDLLTLAAIVAGTASGAALYQWLKSREEQNHREFRQQGWEPYQPPEDKESKPDPTRLEQQK